MRKFLINICFFFIPVLLLLEIRARNFDGQYAQKARGLETLADSIELLIVGNSHPNDNISPQEFDLFAYNAAFGSQSLYFDKRITLNYLEQLPKLRFVLISIEFSSFYRLHRSSRDKFYHYYYGVDFEGQSFLKEDISYFFFGYMPKYAIQHMFEPEEELFRGWKGQTSQDTINLTPGAVEARASYFNNLASENVEMRPAIIKDLEGFVEELLKKEIQPVFITNPIHEDLKSLLNPEVLRKDENDLIYISEKYQIPYRSYLNTPFQDDEFYNSDHLNERGAKRFSKMLNDYIKDLERN